MTNNGTGIRNIRQLLVSFFSPITIMNKKTFCALSGLILVIIMSACIISCGDTSSTNQSVSTPTHSESILVSYQRSGGIAGLLDQLTIYSDGFCELQQKNANREFTIESSQLTHLQQLLEDYSFLSLEEEYLPLNDIPDSIEYEISYPAKDGKTHVVRTVDGSIPDALQPILAELNHLFLADN